MINPEYLKALNDPNSWDPFAHMANAYGRINIGPSAFDVVCRGCGKMTTVTWGGPTADGSYKTTCTECGYVHIG